MNDIYDRTKWPSPESNPLVLLLQRGDEWYSNEELVRAFGLSADRALLSRGTSLVKILRDNDAALVSRDELAHGKSIGRSHGGQQRVFNRRALILAAMRTNTVNAAAFRDWLASRMAEEVSHG